MIAKLIVLCAILGKEECETHTHTHREARKRESLTVLSLVSAMGKERLGYLVVGQFQCMDFLCPDWSE